MATIRYTLTFTRRDGYKRTDCDSEISSIGAFLDDIADDSPGLSDRMLNGLKKAKKEQSFFQLGGNASNLNFDGRSKIMVIGDYSNSPVCEMSYERMLQLIVKWGEWNRAGRQGGEEVVQFDDKEVRLLPRDCME